MEAKRNDPCPCGSGKKFKKCHGLIEAEKKQVMRSFAVGEAGQNPLVSFTQKILHAIESNETSTPTLNLPPSQASTKEAETPQLAPPRTFKAGPL